MQASRGSLALASFHLLNHHSPQTMNLLDQHGKPMRQVSPSQEIIRLREHILHRLKARYDAAQDTSQNEMHWVQADSLSPNSANQLAVRQKLRNRSRYEVSNNSYLKGVALSLCQDFVGSGPTLQITDSRFTEEQKEVIEKRWKIRAKKIKLRKKLWRTRFAKIQDGEGFMFRIINRRLRHPINSDYRLYECDQVSSFEAPRIKSQEPLEVDGIRFDRSTDEPLAYHLLNEHPGEQLIFSLRPIEGKWIPAGQVIHWFRKDRGWHRGIPETTPSLPLWALLRRYTLAVVQNAEIAADFTVLLKSLQPASTNPFTLGAGGEPTQTVTDDWFDSFPVDRGLMTVLPDQYDLEQLKPTQPVSVYDDFVAALVQEATRCLLAPKNHALGSSGDFNMASANLDRQIYRQSINDERLDCNEEVLDPDLEDWWFEATRTPGYFQDEAAPTSVVETTQQFEDLRMDPPEHTYRWDEVPEHVDPVKVAQSIVILHEAGHISDTDIQEGRYNRRVEDHYRNLERQQEWREANNASTFQTMTEAPPAIEDSEGEEI